jgi:predicted transposase/invertase (TIGR01784 family)
MTPQQYEQYQESLLTYIEVKEVVKNAKDDGKREVAARMKMKGFSLKDIAEMTDLSIDEIKEL